MYSPEATIILKSPDGAWTSVGTEASRGIVPEGITVTANEFGPDTCSFSLRREASLPWPDLLAFNQADVIIGGTLVWGGRIWEAPVSDGDEDVIAVNGRGWQYHLDDDQIDRFYVHNNIADYRDQRGFANADLALFYAAGQINASDGGGAQLVWPAPAAVPNGGATGVTLDLGPTRVPKRIVITYRTSNNGGGVVLFYARSHSTENAQAGSVSDAVAGTALTTLGASGTVAGTFATGYRYVSLFLYIVTGGAIGDPGHWIKLDRVQLFSATAYESGNASVLKASQVVADVLASGAVPLLDSSTSGIVTTPNSIPELAPSGYQTPRSLIAAANAYEGNLFGVDAERRVFYRERDTYPSIEAGSWPGASFQDASTNSGDGLYNKVIVQGTGPDGATLSRTVTATSSLLNRQGFTRTAVLSVEAAIDTAGADFLGNVWISEKSSPPLKGSLVLNGWGGARYLNGGDVHPSEMMLRYGQLIRLGQLVDPSTGDQGRDGIIKAVSYNHDTETATLELDSERGRLETLLSRLAVVTSQIR